MATRIWQGDDGAAPNDWSVAANWSGSAVPVNGDDVHFIDNTVDVTAGLDQSAIVLNSLTFDMSYTGDIGADDTSFLQISASTVIIGEDKGTGTPTGSRRLNLDLKSDSSSVGNQITVLETSTVAEDTTRSPVRIIAADADDDLFIRGTSRVSIADNPDQTASFDKIEINSDDADVNIGEGVTFDTLLIKAGTVECRSIPTTSIDVEGGTLTLEASATLALLTLAGSGATVVYNSTGTLTLCELIEGTLDFTQSTKTRTATTIKPRVGSSLLLDPSIVTITTLDLSQITTDTTLIFST